MFKKIIIVCLSISTLSKSQQILQHSVFVNTGLGSYSNIVKYVGSLFKYWRPTLGFGYRVEHSFDSSNVTLGAMLQYQLLKNRFDSDCGCAYSTNVVVKHENMVRLQSMQLPIFMKIQSMTHAKRPYFVFGLGVKWLFDSKTEVNRITTPLNSDPVIFEAQNTNDYKFRNKNGNTLGSFIMLNLGKNFKIGTSSFYTELMYSQDINAWHFEYNDGYLPLRFHTIALNLGYKL